MFELQKSLTVVVLLGLASISLGVPVEEDPPSVVPGMYMSEMNALLDSYTGQINSLCPGNQSPVKCGCEYGLR